MHDDLKVDPRPEFTGRLEGVLLKLLESARPSGPVEDETYADARDGDGSPPVQGRSTKELAGPTLHHYQRHRPRRVGARAGIALAAAAAIVTSIVVWRTERDSGTTLVPIGTTVAPTTSTPVTATIPSGVSRNYLAPHSCGHGVQCPTAPGLWYWTVAGQTLTMNVPTGWTFDTVYNGIAWLAAPGAQLVLSYQPLLLGLPLPSPTAAAAEARLRSDRRVDVTDGTAVTIGGLATRVVTVRMVCEEACGLFGSTFGPANDLPMYGKVATVWLVDLPNRHLLAIALAVSQNETPPTRSGAEHLVENLAFALTSARDSLVTKTG